MLGKFTNEMVVPCRTISKNTFGAFVIYLQEHLRPSVLLILSVSSSLDSTSSPNTLATSPFLARNHWRSTQPKGPLFGVRSIARKPRGSLLFITKAGLPNIDTW